MVGCSWTDSKSRRRSVQCATCCGRTHSKTSAARKQRNISHTTVFAVAHISTGQHRLSMVNNWDGSVDLFESGLERVAVDEMKMN